ncbi:LysR family transcriptional regulator [Pseudomonas sp. E2-15]
MGVASTALLIAQPAISQQLRNLEQDMGMQLLERSPQGMVPTAAGQTLYRHAVEHRADARHAAGAHPRSRVESAMQGAGLPFAVEFEANSTDLLFSAVLARLGVTILPWAAAYVELAQQSLKLARIDHRLFSRELSLRGPDTAVQSNAVQKVKETILELFEGFEPQQGWAAAG